jgi:hypothetical protein
MLPTKSRRRLRKNLCSASHNINGSYDFSTNSHNMFFSSETTKQHPGGNNFCISTTPCDFKWRIRPQTDVSLGAVKIVGISSDRDCSCISRADSIGSFLVSETFLLLEFNENFNTSIRRVYYDFVFDRLEVPPPSVVMTKKRKRSITSTLEMRGSNAAVRQIHADFSLDRSNVPPPSVSGKLEIPEPPQCTDIAPTSDPGEMKESLTLYSAPQA